jgi:hypothetical protein
MLRAASGSEDGWILNDNGKGKPACLKSAYKGWTNLVLFGTSGKVGFAVVRDLLDLAPIDCVHRAKRGQVGKWLAMLKEIPSRSRPSAPRSPAATGRFRVSFIRHRVVGGSGTPCHTSERRRGVRCRRGDRGPRAEPGRQGPRSWPTCVLCGRSGAGIGSVLASHVQREIGRQRRPLVATRFDTLGRSRDGGRGRARRPVRLVAKCRPFGRCVSLRSPGGEHNETAQKLVDG